MSLKCCFFTQMISLYTLTFATNISVNCGAKRICVPVGPSPALLCCDWLVFSLTDALVWLFSTTTNSTGVTGAQLFYSNNTFIIFIHSICVQPHSTIISTLVSHHLSCWSPLCCLTHAVRLLGSQKSFPGWSGEGFGVMLAWTDTHTDTYKNMHAIFFFFWQ